MVHEGLSVQEIPLVVVISVMASLRNSELFLIMSFWEDPFQIIHYSDLTHYEQISPLSWSFLISHEADI